MTLRDAPGRLERILAGDPGGPETTPQDHSPSLAERRRFHRRGRFRWRISPRALTTTALCLLALLGAWWAFTATAPAQSSVGQPSAAHGSVASLRPVPSVHQPGAGRPEAERPGSGPTGPAPGSSLILVHVSGAVRHPGIVRLPATARVFQAVEKAGGALDTAELDALNLAEPLQDGRKVHVPQRGERVSGADAGPSEPGGPGGPRTAPGAAQVHLNSASEAELMTLPRVGKVLADRIIAWREQHGPFGTIEDLDAVDGIGPRMLEQLTPLLVFDSRP